MEEGERNSIEKEGQADEDHGKEGGVATATEGGVVAEGALAKTCRREEAVFLRVGVTPVSRHFFRPVLTRSPLVPRGDEEWRRDTAALRDPLTKAATHPLHAHMT